MKNSSICSVLFCTRAGLFYRSNDDLFVGKWSFIDLRDFSIEFGRIWQFAVDLHYS